MFPSSVPLKGRQKWGILCQTSKISVYRLLDAEVKGVADEGVADADFVEPGDALVEVGEVLEAEVVAGVEAEAAVAGGDGGGDEGGDGSLAVSGVLLGIVGGVQLHTVGAGLGGHLNHVGIGVDEDAHADAARLEFLDNIHQVVLVLHRVPAGIGGEYPFGVGDEGHLSGLDFLHQVDEAVGLALGDAFGVALDIELRSHGGLEVVDIAVADVALVGTGMDSDALRAETLAVDGELEDVGRVAATRVADGGDLVDVDAESGHSYRRKMYWRLFWS